MDAVIIVHPHRYQRRADEPASPPARLRTLHVGPHDEGPATFLIYPPDDLVLVVRIQRLGE